DGRVGAEDVGGLDPAVLERRDADRPGLVKGLEAIRALRPATRTARGARPATVRPSRSRAHRQGSSDPWKSPSSTRMVARPGPVRRADARCLVRVPRVRKAGPPAVEGLLRGSRRAGAPPRRTVRGPRGGPRKSRSPRLRRDLVVRPEGGRLG